MSDDIVTRLRIPLPYNLAGLTTKDLGNERYEAADEIERLQKLVTTWIICAERLVDSNEGEAYEKALEFYVDCQRIAKETC